MKRIILYLLAALLQQGSLWAYSTDSLFLEGNKLYGQKKYTEAVQSYEQLLKQGVKSAPIYYNMGNAFFRLQDFGHSILFYERAARLDPNNEEIATNLKIANARLKDDLVALPPFILQKWGKAFRDTFSANEWAVVSLICFAIFLLSFFLFLRRRILSRQRIILAVSCLFILASVIGIWASVEQRNHVLRTDEAIVMTTELSLRSSPDEKSSEVILIHEGQKVKILDSLNEWKKIRVASGQAGWVYGSTLEII